MKVFIQALVVNIILTCGLQAQDMRSIGDYPVVVTLNFHALSLPFKNLKSNLKNFGIGIGTQRYWGSSDEFIQNISLMWYQNKAIGNGIMLLTQFGWNAMMGDQFYAEPKLGVGYLYSFRPVTSYRQVNQEWVSVGKKGKGMMVIPTGVDIGYISLDGNTNQSPFVGYQFILVNNYNKSLPLAPMTMLQFGSKFKD